MTNLDLTNNGQIQYYVITTNYQISEFTFKGTRTGTDYTRMPYTVSGGIITGIGTINPHSSARIMFLPIDGIYQFIPSSDYDPATKKYVDDAIATAIANLNS